MVSSLPSVPLLVQWLYNGTEEGLQEHASLEKLCPDWSLQCAYPKATSQVTCKQPDIVFLKGKMSSRPAHTRNRRSLCSQGWRDGRDLAFSWWLMKMFRRPRLHPSMENIRRWGCAGQISLPVRLQNQKHSGRGPRNAHSRAYLPSPGLSPGCPLTSWISRWRLGKE